MIQCKNSCRETFKRNFLSNSFVCSDGSALTVASAQVAGDTVLPVLSCVWIATYWLIGLTLPLPQNTRLDGNVSNCVAPL